MSHFTGSRFGRDRSGQAVAEFALVLPLLLLVVLALIEAGNALGVAHSLSRVSREGANIAARGTGMDTVLAVVMRAGRDIRLDGRGGSIVSRIDMEDEGPVVTNQVATAGFEKLSRIGMIGDPAEVLADLRLQQGGTYYVVELFYRYESITPLPRLVSEALPTMIYDRAIF